MEWLSRSDTFLLVFAAYFAVMSLVRLMRRRRDDLVADVQQQVESRSKRAKRAPESGQQTRGAA
jgi:hypothetical protein